MLPVLIWNWIKLQQHNHFDNCNCQGRAGPIASYKQHTLQMQLQQTSMHCKLTIVVPISYPKNQINLWNHHLRSQRCHSLVIFDHPNMPPLGTNARRSHIHIGTSIQKAHRQHHCRQKGLVLKFTSQLPLPKWRRLHVVDLQWPSWYLPSFWLSQCAKHNPAEGRFIWIVMCFVEHTPPCSNRSRPYFVGFHGYVHPVSPPT